MRYWEGPSRAGLAGTVIERRAARCGCRWSCSLVTRSLPVLSEYLAVPSTDFSLILSGSMAVRMCFALKIDSCGALLRRVGVAALVVCVELCVVW